MRDSHHSAHIVPSHLFEFVQRLLADGQTDANVFEVDAIWDYDEDDPDDVPQCPDCGCDLYTENHAWDCSYADDDDLEDE